MKEVEQQINVAFLAALKNNDVDTAASLLRLGANPNVVTSVDLFGYGVQDIPAMLLPLLWPVCHGAREEEREASPFAMVKLLVEAGANVNTAMPHSWTPLIAAAELSETELVVYLLDHGADLHQIAHFGQTVLFIACVTGNTELLRLLLQRGADINRMSLNLTPLIIVAHNVKTVEGADLS